MRSSYRLVIVLLVLVGAGGLPARPEQAQTQTPKPAAPAAKPATQEQIPPAAPGALYPALAARINGKAVLGRDLDRLVKTELATIGSPAWKSLREEYRQELTSKHLGSLVASELMYQKAIADGIKVTDAEVQAELAKLAKSFASDAEMNVALAKQGMDRAALVKDLDRTLTINRFIQENAAQKVSVTPAEVSQYYSSHTEEFRHPDLVRTSHILIAVKEGASEVQDKAAKDKAEALLARIKKGEDFARLAKENSSDGSAAQGGDIGWAAAGDTAPEYEYAAFALEAGAVSEVVRTQFGYHILKVTAKKKEGVDSLDDVKASLTDFLKAQKIQEQLKKIVDGLRAQAKIEVLLPTGSLPSGRTP